MTYEEAMEKAREMLSRGFVVGAFAAGVDAICSPTPERVEQVAQMIMRGEAKE